MWDEGWKEFSEFGVCWGYNKSEKVIYEATYEKSMGCKTFREDRVEDKKEYFVLTSKLEDIPLMIGQPGAKHREGIPDLTECIPLMAKILRGEECLIPKNQKLINKRLKMKTQFNHLWKIIGLCQSFIIRHIDSQCRDHSPLRGEPKIFVLNVKNCKYYCYSDGMKWIDSDSVITLDENPNEIIR